MIEGNECDGQLAVVQKIENYPGFPQAIAGEELIAKMRLQAKQSGARFYPGEVKKVTLCKRPFQLELVGGSTLQCETLIIALGSVKKWLGLPSEEVLKGKGVHGSATCDGALYLGKKVVVIGGADSALEEALTLDSLAEKVVLLCARERFFAAPYLQERVLKHPKIEVQFNSEIQEIGDVSQGKVTHVTLKNGETLICEGVFVSVGRRPNTDLFIDALAMDERGYLVLAGKGTATMLDGIFAAGDVADSTYRKVSTAIGSGCMAALDAIEFIKKLSRV